VYVEGDGLAWISRSRASPDPTPINPVALQLALAQPEGNAAYLARACQFVDASASRCDPQYWTSSRFALITIESTNRALDRLKTRFAAQELVLVGYSGGAAVALLAASRRSDVVRVITVAGNLDHRAWTRHHHLSPLSGSLNPADEISALSKVPQVHLVGGKDVVLPVALARQFVGRFGSDAKVRLVVEPEFDHHQGWIGVWSSLWRQCAGGDAQ